jgi:uncharacterized membrane protein YdjX (TVP38/TMEM64 family)|tara:strand:- start:3396 stop:4067 length:672 start_codon:yes stop_codon:yes gene_type:complete
MSFFKLNWQSIKSSHILFFVFVALAIYIASTGTFIDYFSQFIQDDIVGAISFILLFAFVTVIAPLTALPLVVPASAIFGPFLTSIYSITGWTLGAVIAFLIARHLGKPLLTAFISLERLEKYEKYFSGNVEFFGLVLLRFILPVDLLSYAVGLLSRISFKKYTLATVVGITPFAFIFAYIGDALAQKQYMTFIVFSAGVVLFFGFTYIVYKIYRLSRIGQIKR